MVKFNPSCGSDLGWHRRRGFFDYSVSNFDTLTCTAANTAAAGTFASNVTGAVAGGNYNITYFSGTLTVQTEYTVNVSAASNGIVSVDRTEAPSGAQVTITVTPKSGYKLSTLTVTGDDGKVVAVSTDNSGKYYFAMPNCNVTVKATFSKISTYIADPTNPKTGDDFHIMLYGSILTMSLAGLTALLLAYRKRRQTL